MASTMEYEKKRKATLSPINELSSASSNEHKKAIKMCNEEGQKQATTHEVRSRTPSGTEIKNRVRDIRRFFGQKNTVNGRHIGNLNQVKNSYRQVTNRLQPHRAAKVKGRHAPLNMNQNKKRKTVDTPDVDLNDQSDSSEWENASDSDDQTSYMTPEASVNSTHHQHPKEDTINATKSSPQNSLITTMEKNTRENPQSISISSVMEMFKELKRDMNKTRKEESETLRQDLLVFKKTCVETASEEINKVFTQQSETVKTLQSDINYWKLKSDTLTEVCDRMYTEIEDLTSRVENLELNNSKRMLIISGLHLIQDGKKADNLYMIQQFLYNSMNIEPRIEDYFVLGQYSAKPQIVIILQTSEDRRMILQNKKLLKDYKQPPKVYINEYFPSATHDKRKREAEITEELQNEGKGDQVSYGRGGLCIRGSPYRRKIQPPTPAEMIDLEPEQLEEIFNLESTRGDIITLDKSEFTGYAAKVKCHDDIKLHYIRLKMIQPNARHVVCAYSIKDKDPCYARDYHDDGEPSAGRTILQILKENLVENTVVFVARKYGGLRMGANRFKCYSDAAKSALGITTTDRTDRTSNQQHRPSNSYNTRGNTRTSNKSRGTPAPAPTHRQAGLNNIRGAYSNNGRGSYSNMLRTGNQNSRFPRNSRSTPYNRGQYGYSANSAETNRGRYNQHSTGPARGQRGSSTRHSTQTRHQYNECSSSQQQPTDAPMDWSSQHDNDDVRYAFSNPSPVTFQDNNTQQEQWSNENNGQWDVE